MFLIVQAADEDMNTAAELFLDRARHAEELFFLDEAAEEKLFEDELHIKTIQRA
jgi:hypothetical protein